MSETFFGRRPHGDWKQLFASWSPVIQVCISVVARLSCACSEKLSMFEARLLDPTYIWHVALKRLKMPDHVRVKVNAYSCNLTPCFSSSQYRAAETSSIVDLLKAYVTFYPSRVEAFISL